MHETWSFELRVGQFSEFSCFRLPEISFTVDHQYLFWRWTKLLLGLSSRRKIKPAKGRPSGFSMPGLKTAENWAFSDWSNPKTNRSNSWYFTGCPLMVLYWFSVQDVESLWISLCLVWQEHVVKCCDFMHRWGATLKQESMMYQEHMDQAFFIQVGTVFFDMILI